MLIFVDWPIEVVMRQNYCLESEQTWLFCLVSWRISDPGRPFLSARQTLNLLVKWQETFTPVCIFPRRLTAECWLSSSFPDNRMCHKVQFRASHNSGKNKWVEKEQSPFGILILSDVAFAQGAATVLPCYRRISSSQTCSEDGTCTSPTYWKRQPDERLASLPPTYMFVTRQETWPRAGLPRASW